MAPDYQSSRRPLAVFLITFGAILLVGSFAYGYLFRSSSHLFVESLPRRIAGFTLNKATYGSDAVAEISRMHGREFPTTSGAMGTYGNAYQISLWIEGFENASSASQIVSAMENRIALGNSPFSPTGQLNVGNREVYYLDGLGQKHAYFQSGDLVIWLAADPAVADQAFQQILEEYP